MTEIKNYNVHAARTKALIVDDSVSMRKLLRAMISNMGITQIEEATDGQHAIQFIEKQPFDFILSDWKMEPMDGLELCRWVRAQKDPLISAIPFILVSAYYAEDLVKDANSAGVNLVMRKPIEPKMLRKEIETIVLLKSKVA